MCVSFCGEDIDISLAFKSWITYLQSLFIHHHKQVYYNNSLYNINHTYFCF